MKPIEGDLYGNCSGSSTWIFHTPLANGAGRERSHDRISKWAKVSRLKNKQPGQAGLPQIHASA